MCKLTCESGERGEDWVEEQRSLWVGFRQKSKQPRPVGLRPSALSLPPSQEIYGDFYPPPQHRDWPGFMEILTNLDKFEAGWEWTPGWSSCSPSSPPSSSSPLLCFSTPQVGSSTSTSTRWSLSMIFEFLWWWSIFLYPVKNDRPGDDGTLRSV